MLVSACQGVKVIVMACQGLKVCVSIGVPGTGGVC